MKVKVGYSQGAKVSNPSDRYENASFNVNLGFEFDFEELPAGDEASYDVWKEALRESMSDAIQELRAQVEEELEKDIVQFQTDNAPG